MKNAKRKKEPVLKRLLPYAGRKKYLLYIAMLSSALSGILVLMPMVYIHKIVSGIILTGKIDPVSINHNAICAASFAVGGLLLYSFTLILSHIFAFEVEQNIISRNVKKLMAKPLGFFTNRESGNLRKTIVDGAAETHTMLAHQMPDIAMTMITPVVLLVFFFYFDWRLGLASMLPILISFGIMASMTSKKNLKMRDEYFDGQSKLSAEIVEYVRGIPVVKTFAQSIESFDRLYSLIIKLKQQVVAWSMSFKNKMSLFEAVSGSTSFFLVPIAILMITTGGNVREVIGNSVIYLLIGPTFGIFIMRSATIKNFIYFAELALNKIDEALEYKDLNYGTEIVTGDGLEFKDISFSYGNEKVLDHISFKVNKGETVALVGVSGGGKTTIAKLAARFYDPDEGSILIGGTNIKAYNKSSLMQKISFVFQNPKLFRMSIRENLLLGRPEASEEELCQALEKAGAKDIVDNLEKGLDTIYGTKGTYFSGGEAQRLSIARAFLKNADIVILDEATAFADQENEHIIQASFKELSKNKTTLMIAHRLSTVKGADRILVIDKGKIKESGSHEDLLEQNGIYKKLWDEYQKSADWKIGGKND